MHLGVVVSILSCVALASSSPAQSRVGPGIDDLLNLKRVGSPVIAPDGRMVAYTVRETNWDENEFETEIWVGTAAESRPLTSGRKSSLQPAWSPDGKWLAFISDRDGKRQLYRIALAGGEAEKLTRGDEGVNAFAWAPDGQRFLIAVPAEGADAPLTMVVNWMEELRRN
jgi:dipeptidyl aminopeptidase/acylaminoacyl peptidase